MDMNALMNQGASVLSRIVVGLLYVLAAWIIASLVRRGAKKGFSAIDFDQKLENWGMANDASQADGTISAISNALYYLVWVFFLPPIFNAFGLSSISDPIVNMFNTAFSYLPNIIGAVIIVSIGLFVAKFVRNLVYNLLISVNIDGLIGRFANKSGSKDNQHTIANVAGTLVYVLVLIPILIVALETLGIRSITTPIIGVLNTILSAIPNILVAAILLGVGIAIAKLVGDLITDLLEGAGINRVNEFFESSKTINLAKIVGQFVAVLISLFFFVEALNALNLEVLNAVGTSLILYLPNIIGAALILALGIIGGELLSGFVTNAAGSKWLGEIVKYVLVGISLFMAINQLGLATEIVNTAFLFIMAGLAVAFALAFGLGGQDFARKQLDKLQSKLDEEAEKTDSVERLDQKIQKRAQEVTRQPQTDHTAVSPEEDSGQGSRSQGDSIE